MVVYGEDGRILTEVDVVTPEAIIEFKSGPSSAQDVIEQVQERLEPNVTRPVVTFINDSGKGGIGR